MESNFWFYTLSTIPQTLGAIIALTATFIIFKLDNINKSIDSHCYHIKIILRSIGKRESIPNENNPEFFLELFEEKGVIKLEDAKWIRINSWGLSEAYKKIVSDPLGTASIDDLKEWLNVQIRDDLEKKNSNKKSILFMLKVSLILVGFTIISCLWFLPLYGAFSNCWKTWIIFSLFGFAALSIGVTIFNIYRIVKL